MDLQVTQPRANHVPSQGINLLRRRWKFSLLCIIAAGLLGLGIDRLRYDLRSYSLLVHFLDPSASGPLLRWETHAVTAQEVMVEAGENPVRARLYLPTGVGVPPGMVVVHGIHHLGMNEPRLVSFARAASATGFAVLTPEVSALADYRVDAPSIITIGAASEWLQQRLGTGPPTVIGVSLAGGLALLAARDPRYATHMRALLLLGAYDDLGRVSRFLATSEAELPDGRRIPYAAHDYGAAVFVYSHLEQFFLPGDLRVAREALRDWLWEQPQNAQALLAQLSPPGRAVMDSLLARQVERLRPQLLNAIQADSAQLAALSPAGRLGNLHVPVFILHGAADDIVPSTESLWLEREVPRRYLRAALITRAFSHVDLEKRAHWLEELRLVGFLAEVLRAAS